MRSRRGRGERGGGAVWATELCVHASHSDTLSLSHCKLFIFHQKWRRRKKMFIEERVFGFRSMSMVFFNRKAKWLFFLSNFFQFWNQNQHSFFDFAFFSRDRTQFVPTTDEPNMCWLRLRTTRNRSRYTQCRLLSRKPPKRTASHRINIAFQRNFFSEFNENFLWSPSRWVGFRFSISFLSPPSFVMLPELVITLIHLAPFAVPSNDTARDGNYEDGIGFEKKCDQNLFGTFFFSSSTCDLDYWMWDGGWAAASTLQWIVINLVPSFQWHQRWSGNFPSMVELI